MPENLTNLGAVAIIFIFAVREFFAYLRSRKNGTNGNFSEEILRELRIQNENHLHSIKDAIVDGNTRLVEMIHMDNTKIIEVLGEIKGSLQNR